MYCIHICKQTLNVFCAPLPFNTLASVAVEGAIFNQLQIFVDCFYLNLRIFKKYIVDIVQGKIFHL